MNRLEKVAPEIGGCTRLRRLKLSGNRLRRLPEELGKCKQVRGTNKTERMGDWTVRDRDVIQSSS